MSGFNAQSWLFLIIKYIPLQQGLRHKSLSTPEQHPQCIIKYIPLQQGLRQPISYTHCFSTIIKYIPLQQGLRHQYL